MHGSLRLLTRALHARHSSDVVGCVWGGASVLGLGILAFARGWFGGDDVKRLAAVSLWAGPAHLSLLLLVTALVGGILSLIILCRPLLQRLAAGPDAAVETSREVPYGIAIAVGGIAVASQLLAF